MSQSAAEPRWRRLPEARPKQILDAALVVFAERGPAAAMLSALFVTHALWSHKPTAFTSVAHIPDDELLSQIREFFLSATRPDAPAPSSIA